MSFSFRRHRADSLRLSDEETHRQSRIVSIAKQWLDGTDAVLAFLNHHDARLGGRPLDVATASAEGFAAVETALSRRNPARASGRRGTRPGLGQPARPC